MSKGLLFSFVPVVFICSHLLPLPLGQTIETRIAPPPGYTRAAEAQNSFGNWLRNFPLKHGRPPVRLFDGRLKANQAAHFAVLDIDTGRRDLQQCADAVMRLRAEFLRAGNRADEIAFNFTSGDRLGWADWRKGVRPTVKGNHVTWQTRARSDDSPASFREYLDTTFMYAGSHSLEKELVTVGTRDPIQPGDVFIQGGFPGHAVILMDVVADASGHRMFLLAQSYMPAQDVHILVNPTDAMLSPWYRDGRTQPLVTPEWTFPAGSLRRSK